MLQLGDFTLFQVYSCSLLFKPKAFKTIECFLGKCGIFISRLFSKMLLTNDNHVFMCRVFFHLTVKYFQLCEMAGSGVYQWFGLYCCDVQNEYPKHLHVPKRNHLVSVLVLCFLVICQIKSRYSLFESGNGLNCC